MINESFSQQPLAQIIPSYCYFQFADDTSVQAFISSYNAITQSYLSWFINTPLSVYTSPSISGPLLDWTAQSIYGYARPFLITGAVYGKVTGGYGFAAMGISAYGVRRGKITPGTAISVSDDVYKRALTWQNYLGDGKQMSVQWLKRRIARFLYGANGSDVPINNLQNISIATTSIVLSGGFYGSRGYFGDVAFGMKNVYATTKKQISIILPNTPLSATLDLLIDGGFLAIPFQANLQITIHA